MITFLIGLVWGIGYLIAWPKTAHWFIRGLANPDSFDRCWAAAFGTLVAGLWPVILVARTAAALIMRTDALRSDPEIEERARQRAVAAHNRQREIERLAEQLELPPLNVRDIIRDLTGDDE